MASPLQSKEKTPNIPSYTLFLSLVRQPSDDPMVHIVECPLGHWSVQGHSLLERENLLEAYMRWGYCLRAGHYTSLIRKFTSTLDKS